MTQQLLSGPAARPRPYRVSNCERTVRKGIMAESLNDLLEKVSGKCRKKGGDPKNSRDSVFYQEYNFTGSSTQAQK